MTLRIVPLAQVGDDPAEFGGKARGLARLARIGAAVPAAFTVEPTDRPPADWSADDRERFHELLAPLLALGRVAVRSSARGEDGAAASFAGLFDTTLSIADPVAAEAAAGRCIASGAGERVRAYVGGALPVGIVVQHQIEAAVAGVCFTVDPTGRDAAVVIEAVAGLGEALVSGHAQPDRWRVYLTGTGAWEARRDGTPASPLDASAATLLAEQARELAERLGGPLDLEWAIDAAGRTWWLQARPITAAAPPPELVVDRAVPQETDGAISVWANFNLRETMPLPLSPLGWSFWRDYVAQAFTQIVVGLDPRHARHPAFRLYDLVNGRIYWNLNAMIAIPVAGPFIHEVFATVDPQAGRAVPPLVRAGVLRPRRFPASPLRLVLDMLLHHLSEGRALALALRPHRAAAAMEAFGAAERAHRARPLAPLTERELLGEVTRIRMEELGPMRHLGRIATAGGAWFLVSWLLFRAFPEARRNLHAVARTPTAQVAVAMDELVSAALPLGDRFSADEQWLAKFRSFIELHGQRCPREFDLAVPRWDEDPGMIHALVRAAQRSERPAESAGARAARVEAERRATIAEAIARSPSWKRPLMRLAARMVEAYVPLRELPKHVLLIAFHRARRAVLELGRRLAARGALAQGDEVWSLELSELADLIDGRLPAGEAARLVAARRERIARWSARPAPDFVRSDGVPVVDRPPVVEGALVGVAVSPGVATGRVRVLHEPDPEAFEDGDVLVVELADPGWTPIFPRAAAIVMEVGGVMCHAAVVARELGVPAVVGVRDARARLKDGQRVTVDGDAGLVRLD